MILYSKNSTILIMQRLSSRPRKSNLCLLPAFLIVSLLSGSYQSFAQPCTLHPRLHKVTADVSPTIKSFMEFLPVDFQTNPTKKYPLVVYLGGTGEMFQQPGGDDYDLCPML